VALPFLTALLERSRTASTPAGQHQTAYYALEAGIRLAATVRLATWREVAPGDPKLAQVQASLGRASLGVWLGALRHASRALARDEHELAELALDLEPFAAWSGAAVGEGVVKGSTPRDALESLDLVVRWRNAVLGHGAWRDEPFYARYAPLLLEAAEALVRSSLPGGGLTWVRATGTGWSILSGHEEPPPSPAPTGRVAVYSGSGGLISLWPLVASRSHPLLEEAQTGLLNKAIARGGTVRTVHYLDYLSGETFTAPSQTELGTWLDLDQENEAVEAEPGRWIGDYRLLETLGEGATATVHLAEQHPLGRRVALKILAADLAKDDTSRARFAREVKALARVEHPAIVRLVTAGSLEDGRPYYAMDYVQGADLTSAEIPRDPLALARLFAGVADGLHALHTAGVVHRDLKPANLIWAGSRVVVVDLGLAALDDATLALTRTDNRLVGTLRYLPPEQLQSDVLDADGRADVYGLCASLFHVVTGAPPLDGRTEARLVEQVLHQTPPLARTLRGDCPESLERLLAWGLAKSPDDRPQSAAALAVALRDVADGRTPAMPATVKRGIPLAGWAALAVVVLGVAIVGTWWWDHTRTKTWQAAALEIRSGAYHPVGRLDEGLPASSFRVETVGGEVVRVSWPDGLLEPGRWNPHPSNPPVNEILFDWHAGDIRRMELRDAWGTVVRRIDVEPIEGGHRWRFRNRLGMPVRGAGLPRTPGRLDGRYGRDGRQGVFGVSWEEDERGWPVAATYAGADGSGPMMDHGGAFGARYERDDRGRQVARTWVNEDGEPTHAQADELRVAWTYEGASWRPASERYFDANGDPMKNSLGAAELLWEWDVHGQPRSRKVRGVDGKPSKPDALIPFVEPATLSWRVETVLSQCEQLGWTWSAEGRVTRKSCLRSDGEPDRSIGGFHAMVYEWEEGCLRSQRLVDREGELAGSKGGEAAIQRECGPHGRPIRLTREREDGSPLWFLHRPAGVAVERTLDDLGRVQSERVVDAAGSSVAMGIDATRVVVSRREDGLVDRVVFLGVGDAPAIGPELVHGVQMHYDELGRWRGRTLLDRAGDPSLGAPHWHYEPHPGGCLEPATSLTTFDNAGLEVRTETRGADGRPYETELGYATVTTTVARDRVWLARYFGANGEPTPDLNGCYQRRTQNDGQRRIIVDECLGIDGQPVLDNTGTFRQELTYTRGWQWDSIVNYGVPPSGSEGFPVLGRRVRRFEANRMVRTEALDAEGELVVMAPGGVAALHARRNEDGLAEEVTTFGRDGAPLQIVSFVGDFRGRILEMHVRRPDGSPTIAPFFVGPRYVDQTITWGSHGAERLQTRGFVGGQFLERITHIEYGPEGRASRYRFTDIEGQPAPGDAVQYPSSNLLDTLIETSLRYAPSHDPRLTVGHVEGIEQRWDGTGRLIEEWVLDGEEQPRLDDAGVHRVVVQYEDLPDGGLQELRRCYGIHGQPAACGDGAFSIRVRTNAAGHMLSQTFRTADGEPVNGHLGASDVNIDYSRLNQRMASRFLRADGSVHPESSRVVRDDHGRLASLMWESPLAGGASVAEYGWAADPGYMVTIRLLDENGDPVVGPEGWSEFRARDLESVLESPLATFLVFWGDDRPPPLLSR